MPPGPQSFIARIARIRHYDEETGEIEVVVRPPEAQGTKGVAEKIVLGRTGRGWLEGEVFLFTGTFEVDRRLGSVFRVTDAVRRPPATQEQAAEYLSTNVKGLGKARALELLNEVGGLTGFMALITDNRMRFWELLPKRIAKSILQVDWAASEIDPDLVMALKESARRDGKGHGMPMTRMRRIIRHFGNSGTREVINTKPYRLCEIRGIGWQTAEDVAVYMTRMRQASFDKLDADRLMYGLVHYLGQERGQGHTCVPVDMALQRAARKLGIERVTGGEAALVAAKSAAVERKLIVEEYQALYSVSLHRAEKAVADDLRRIINAPVSLPPASRTLLMRRLKETLLSAEQQSAVVLGISSRVSVLTGGPGVGKTATVGEIVNQLRAMHKSFALVAPTGKAAKRMTEATKDEALTIHRLLGLHGTSEQNDDEDSRNHLARQKREFLKAEVLICDESSMIDIQIMRELLYRVKSGATQIIFVGDVNQLTPVGPGQPFRDLIDSEAVPVSRLTKVYRQSDARTEGGIVDCAYRINDGRMPIWDAEGTEFRLFDPRQSPLWAQVPANQRDAWEADTVQGWLVAAHARYAKALGIDPVRDIQVLAAMNKGPYGVVELNRRLQAALNPAAEGVASVRIGGPLRYECRIKDKVIQLKNDNIRGLANGQVGYVTEADARTRSLEVQFDDREGVVRYETHDQLSQLALAYVYTIHRSQGSESPVVLIPLHPSQSIMLYRQLLYTGVTRAKRGFAGFGPLEAFEIAVRETHAGRRHGHLSSRLRAIAVARGTGGGPARRLTI